MQMKTSGNECRFTIQPIKAQATQDDHTSHDTSKSNKSPDHVIQLDNLDPNELLKDEFIDKLFKK